MLPRRPARFLIDAVLSLALGSLATAAAAQTGAHPAQSSTGPATTVTERYDDPIRNGIAIGAALGAIGGVVMTGALYRNCHDLCDAPDDLPTYAMYAGLGAGIGAGTGWLMDRRQCPSPSTSAPIPASAPCVCSGASDASPLG
jgi:hypothetical protein